ncbi:hypothetical protein FDB41_10540 [Clostridium botulinum]|nr:hypothetical protein [Clostridium botulinum]NFO53983.1 hypothetical protein [Clostridium botulinum]
MIKIKFSEFYNINKEQKDLNFVDINLLEDLELFIDPYVFAKLKGEFASKCNNAIINFFNEVITLIRSGDKLNAIRILNGLKEPSETHLGLARHSINGNAVTGKKALKLYTKLSKSNAVKTGNLKDLSDCELMIKGIGKDNISDITTNIIREYLIEFTEEQCKLYDIPMVIFKNNIWDKHEKKWVKKEYKLPCVNGKKVILVPKSIVTDKLILSYENFYNNEILEYYKIREINACTSIVIVLKGGEKTVRKKDLKKKYPKSKEFVFNFVNNNPQYLELYKERKKILNNIDADEIILKAHEKKHKLNCN